MDHLNKSIKTTIEAQEEITNVVETMSTRTNKIKELLETRPEDFTPEEAKELQEYLTKAEQHQEDLLGIQKEFEEVNSKFLEDYDSVVKEETLTGIMNNMEGLIAKYKEEEKLEMAAHYTGILAELKNSISLKPLIDQMPKIKNIGKIANVNEKNLNKSMKKVNDKFAKERTYSFMTIQSTHEALLINGFSQADAAVFINFLCGYILPIDFNKFTNRAFFISQMQQNIMRLGAFDKKEELTNAIYTIVNTINEAKQ